MLTRSAKQAFYVAAGPLMRINGWVYRTFRAPTNTHDRVLRLHLGPGQKAYLPGWIIGGRFVNFVFCRNEHLTMLTESFLREVAQRAGFVGAEKLLPVKETRSPDLFSDCLAKEDEQDFDTPHTIIMEFRK